MEGLQCTEKPRILERDIKRQIKDYLRISGWMCWSNLQGLGCRKGLPDITAVRDGVVLFIEAKRSGGKQSPDQIQFQKDIEQHGGHYVLARSFEDVEHAIERITGEKSVLF